MRIIIVDNDNVKYVVRNAKGVKIVDLDDAVDVELQNILDQYTQYVPGQEDMLSSTLDAINGVVDCGDGNPYYLEELLALIVCNCEKQVGELETLQVVDENKTGWWLLKRFVETSGGHPDWADWSVLGSSAKAWLRELIHDRIKVEQ